MKMRTGVLAIGAACAACCVPLLIPMLAGAGLGAATATGGALLFGLTLDQLLCFGLPAGILVALVAVWWLKRPRAERADCGCQGQCAVGPAPTPE